MFQLYFTTEAELQLNKLQKSNSSKKEYKAVIKALAYLEQNPKHQSLQTHKYHSITGYNGEDVFEAYAQNNSPAAYRIFWHYGPEKNSITIISIVPHP